MNPIYSKTLKFAYYAFMAYFGYLMLLITLQYIPIRFDVAFLKLKEAIAYRHYQIAFFSHVFSSFIVLLAGLTQFSKSIRRRMPSVHKTSGKLYIGFILFVASPSGLIMAYYANGGLLSKISFAIQALLWFIFTIQAYRSIRKGNWQQHQQFMLRSYALTLSAISLRLFKWVIVNTLQLPPMDTYRIVAWLGWVFNLVLVEMYIRIYLKRKL